MKIKYIFLIACCLLPLNTSTAGAQEAARDARNATTTPAARVLLIPLDDRPPCVQFPTLIGQTSDTQLVTPPLEMLGRFTVPGDTARITEWVRAQDIKAFDAIIVSMDMLAYGGLVNSRVHRTSLKDAMARLELVRELHISAPRVPIYGFSVIMRLAPTGDGRNEAYREKLARWAEISPEAKNDPALAREVAPLEAQIPAAALSDYKAARLRNFAVNQASVELIKNGVLDYLILSQDDAKPRGVHVADRERLIAEARKLKLEERIAVQPGADEVAMLLLARALNRKFNYAPRINAVYSSEATRNQVMPFEDQPLHRTVSLQIAATASREVMNADDADVLFYVYASRKEQGAAAAFAEKIAHDVARGRRVIVADIDPLGDVQGADPAFTEKLLKQQAFSPLVGYASWNTAGNTIGTALPHGIVYSLALDRLANQNARAERIGRAQITFLLHRLFDDYAYHTLIRPEARKFAAIHRLNSGNLSGEGEQSTANFISERMRPEVETLWRAFARQRFVVHTKDKRDLVTLAPLSLSDFRISLPWGRLFEALITFDVKAPSTRAVAVTSQILPDQSPVNR